jgi:hypothetical protein
MASPPQPDQTQSDEPQQGRLSPDHKHPARIPLPDTLTPQKEVFSLKDRIAEADDLNRVEDITPDMGKLESTSKYEGILKTVVAMAPGNAVLVSIDLASLSSVTKTGIRDHLFSHLPKDVLSVRTRNGLSNLRIFISKTEKLPRKYSSFEGSLPEGPVSFPAPFDAVAWVYPVDAARARFERATPVPSDVLARIGRAAASLPSGAAILIDSIEKPHVAQVYEHLRDVHRTHEFKVQTVSGGGRTFYMLICAPPIAQSDQVSQDTLDDLAQTYSFPELSCRIRFVEAVDNIKNVPRVFPSGPGRVAPNTYWSS